MGHKLYLLIFFIIIGSCTHTIIGQTMNINGQITDSTGAPLQDALIYNVRISDSSLLSYTRTNVEGLFFFNAIPIDTFSMHILYPGYKTRKLIIVGSEENNNINLNTIKLAPESIKEIDELIIFAYKTPINFKGDTLVFIADSFDVKKNSRIYG